MITNRTILLIDDEPQIRRVLRTSFTAQGANVLDVQSGEEALDVLREHTVDVILLDMSMPGMTGSETLKRLKDASPEVPVIVCSGYVEAEVQREFDGHKLAGILQKPFTAYQLVERVGSILGTSRPPLK